MSRAVRVAVPAAEAELAADALWRAGAAAIEERPGELVAALADGGDPTMLVAAVASRWPAEVVTVDAGAALDAWRAYARPVVVADRLVVRPPWVAPADPSARRAPRDHDGAPDRLPGNHTGAQTSGPLSAAGRPPPGRDEELLDIVIDPGRAFGHGAHPTTRLVLAALADLVLGGERVLDVGCGSGVLAVAALALGADRATGVDVDPAALAATRDNAAHNGLAGRLQVIDDVACLDDPPGSYDLVVANMLLPDLVAVAPAVASATARTGTVVLSGLLVAQRDAALAAYRAVGLNPVDEAAELHAAVETDEQDGGGWLALTLTAG